jgi:hypothetical protein
MVFHRPCPRRAASVDFDRLGFWSWVPELSQCGQRWPRTCSENKGLPTSCHGPTPPTGRSTTLTSSFVAPLPTSSAASVTRARSFCATKPA